MTVYNERSVITEESGCRPVCVQDQTTPPIDNYFAQEISAFTLAADTTAATPTTVPKTFTATTGHGILALDELLLLDVGQNRSFYCVATAVAGDLITIDRSLDESYISATTLGRIVTTEMAVDGSITPQIFTARAGDVPIDMVRFIITMLDSTSMDSSRFGGGPPLPNGLTFRILNHFKKTIFNFKTNGDIKQFCYDLDYDPRAPAGFYGLASRTTFGGPSKHGVVLRIGADDYLQWVVQDDLTGLETLRISLMGHETTD